MQAVAPIIDTLERHGVHVAHHFGGGVYAKETVIPAGVELAQHAHPHDHLSILSRGRVLLEAGDERREIGAPACLTLKAGVPHKVTALTDVLWYCIHATEETDPAKVDTSILTGGAHV